MTQEYCYGRNCKVGWGYNESLDRLTPVEEKLPNLSSKADNCWGYLVYDLPANSILCWKSINHLLKPSCKKRLDFGIVFDNNEYWQVKCSLRKRKDELRKIPKSTVNCQHFVNEVYHGVEIWILFPKTGFPEGNKTIRDLFRDRDFTETQKKTKCKILINYSEVREMTLGKLLEFMHELRGKNCRYDIPVAFEFKELINSIRETVIRNNNKFGGFLSYLYCVYRKIEMRMQRAGYPDVLSDFHPGEKVFENIRANLDKAKEEYKSMDKNDFLKMYPMLKKLFFCYIDYINYSMDHIDDIDEGDNLPGTVNEMKPWLTKLNQWVPININNTWINCASSFIGTPPGYEEIVETLNKVTKFNAFPVVNDTEAVEPYIGRENSKKILFGFVDMEGAKLDEISNTILLESECPKECTSDSRRWICTKCGDFIRIKINTAGPFLFCSCGTKKYKEKFLICHHLAHKSQEKSEEKVLHVPVLEEKEIQSTISDSDNLLSSILRKLEEVSIKNEEATDPRILFAIICLLSKNKNEEDIENILRKLRDVPLDGDTHHFISLYLKKE